MIAMALIHLYFGGDFPLGYVKNKVLLIFFSATTALSSTMIRLNRATKSGRIFRNIFLNIWHRKSKCL